MYFDGRGRKGLKKSLSLFGAITVGAAVLVGIIGTGIAEAKPAMGCVNYKDANGYAYYFKTGALNTPIPCTASMISSSESYYGKDAIGKAAKSSTKIELTRSNGRSSNSTRSSGYPHKTCVTRNDGNWKSNSGELTPCEDGEREAAIEKWGTNPFDSTSNEAAQIKSEGEKAWAEFSSRTNFKSNGDCPFGYRVRTDDDDEDYCGRLTESAFVKAYEALTDREDREDVLRTAGLWND